MSQSNEMEPQPIKLNKIRIAHPKIQHDISALAWNINGISDKLGDPDVQEIIKSHHIVVLTETQKGKSYKVNFPGYYTKHFARKTIHPKAKRASGGMLVLISNKINKHVKIMKQTNEFIIWIQIKAEKNKTLYIGAVYVSPEESSYKSRDNFFECLQKDIDCRWDKGMIALMGDFNARTSNLTETLDSNNIPTTRLNIDQRVNKYGKELINICKYNNLLIINGKNYFKHNNAGYTCQRPNGMSTIDYLITDPSCLKYLTDFRIMPFNANSDHTPLSMRFIIKSDPNHVTKTIRHMRYKWDKSCKADYIKRLSDPHTVDPYHELLCGIADTDFCADDAVNYFYDYIKSAMDGVFKQYKTGGKSEFPVNNWFDTECKIAKTKLNDSLKSKLPCNEINSLRKEYRGLIQKKKRVYYASQADELDKICTKNPSECWKFWKKFKVNRQYTSNIDIESFTDHYKQQTVPKSINTQSVDFMNTIESVIDRIPSSAIKSNDIIIDIMEAPISIDEVQYALKLSKSNKASGEDGIPVEFFKLCEGALDRPLTALFNHILQSGEYPKSWSTGLINPIYKKKSMKDPANYRKITLLTSIGKLFERILNNRLQYCQEALKLGDPMQNGFIKDARTTDNVFILNGIVEKYTALKKPVYMCFVDFKSAFDNVNRKALLFKLLNKGIGGKTFQIIRDLFSKAKSRVKWDNSLGEVFENLYGVLQGGVLSPTLFNIFIEDLPNYLDKSKGVKIDDTMICHLLQADDLVLMSETTAGLQTLIDGLNRFCKVWQIIVNLEKTDIMIFNKQYEYKPHCSTFLLNGIVIKESDKYKYLGTLFSNKKDIFCDNVMFIRDKAMKTIATIFRYARHAFGSQLSFQLMMKIYDAQVRPVMEYGAEIWFRGKSIKELETAQLKFIKSTLGVKQQTSNLAIYGETGRFPLHLRLTDCALKYWDRLNNCNKSKTIYRVFSDLKKLHNSGCETWVSRIQNMIREGCTDQDTFIKIRDYSKNVYLDTKEFRYAQFISYWENSIKDTSKNPILRTYMLFKHNFEVAPYLLCNMPKQFQKSIAQFRTSSHQLRIETGRHEKLPIIQRTCEFCSNGDVDDEIHMLIKCKYHDTDRTTFLRSLPNHMQYDIESSSNLFHTLMTSKDPETVYMVANFINKCFQRRKEGSN